MGKPHVKPTQDELDAQIKKTEAEIDKLDPDAPDVNDDEPNDPEKPPKKTDDEPTGEDNPEGEDDNAGADDDKAGDDDDKKDEPESDEGKDDDEPEKPDDDKKPDDKKPEDEKPDDKKDEPVKPEDEEKTYKQRHADSSRQAQRLAEENAETQKRLKEAMDTPSPTEEELKVEYPNWEILDDFQKKIARDSLQNTNRFKALEKITVANKDREAWAGKVDEFLKDPRTLAETPELEGKETEFKSFAAYSDRLNMNFKDLVSSFLYHLIKNAPVKKKGQMFPKGSAGPSDKGKQKSNKLTVEEGAELRKKKYSKWVEMTRAGKIASE